MKKELKGADQAGRVRQRPGAGARLDGRAPRRAAHRGRGGRWCSWPRPGRSATSSASGRTEADRAFRDALTTFEAPVRDGAAGRAPTGPRGQVFATAEEKYKTAAAAFDGVERRFGSSKIGARAKYYAALARIELGQYAEAEKALKEIQATGRSGLEPELARLALADLYRRERAGRQGGGRVSRDGHEPDRQRAARLRPAERGPDARGREALGRGARGATGRCSRSSRRASTPRRPARAPSTSRAQG